jgi:hypothetical protein
MTSKRTIKVVKREERLAAGDVSSITKTANQLRREMVQTVANWIAETEEGLAKQRKLYQRFRQATIDGALTEND